MENVIIKNIKEMPTKTGGKFWAVELNGNRKATIGQWDSKIADHIIGAMTRGLTEFECELTIKGDYTNITDISMKPIVETIKVKDELPTVGNVEEFLPKKVTSTKYTDKDKSIIAQCLTKICFNPESNIVPSAVLETYNWFIKNLE